MTDDWFVEEMQKAVNSGIVVVNVSQCIGGSVEMERYDTGNRLLNAGVVGGVDMTTEATIVKLMFLLGQTSDQNEVRRLMNVNLAGEINETNRQWKE